MQKKIYLVLSLLILASMALAACGGGGGPGGNRSPDIQGLSGDGHRRY